MNNRPIIYITLTLIWMLSLPEAHAEDSIINQYDANGNLVSGDGKYYEYNDASQLVRVRERDANGALVAEYFYDHTGQRVKKVENGVTTYYLGKHFETKVVQGQAQNTSYYFAEGDRVAKKDSTGTYFYHPDHLGGTSAVTNTAKQVVSSTSYLPFGEVRQGGTEQYTYTGKEKDKASDLYNFEARYVSPELRHFTQADIAEPDFDDPQDLNRYAYVGNNPLSFIDPDGYKKKKKAKLSKREKWMIAHGVDPDHDKTSLKKAKKQEKEGKKYVASKKSNGAPTLASAASAGRVLGASVSTSAIPLCGSSSWACKSYKAQKSAGLDTYKIASDLKGLADDVESGADVIFTASGVLLGPLKGIADVAGYLFSANIKYSQNLWNEATGTGTHYSLGEMFLNVGPIGDILLGDVGRAK